MPESQLQAAKAGHPHMLGRKGSGFQVHAMRWGMLFLFGFLTLVNAILWISFAPISSIAGRYYGVSQTMINLLSLLFMALYLPASLLSTWVFNHYGLRTGLWFASLLNFLSGAARYFSASDDASSRTHGFAIVVIGQVLGAMAQPFFLNSPAKLASEWFAVRERDIATTIASMCNPLGIAVGQVLPSIIVTDSGGMPLMLLVEWGLCGLSSLLALLFRKHPPTPPSFSASSRTLLKERRPESEGFLDSHFVEEFRVLRDDPHFWKLTLGFGLGLAMFNGTTTVIEQLIKPAGYTSSDAGLFGGLVIGGGFLGSAIVAPIMDKTKAYIPIVRTGVLLASAASVFLVLMLRPGQTALLATAFGLLGGGMMPLLPASFELAVETTFPISEETSGGVLVLAGNILGVGTVFLMDYLIQLRPDYTGVLTPCNIFIVVITLFSAMAMFSFKGDYKRLMTEHLGDSLHHSSVNDHSGKSNLHDPLMSVVAE
eukprot:TRINITY_DN15239_c0_g1_i2.p1 TRINITY_DN15239_c0_g1~~TRINITY_DN15239_c0_g1_i2.p1  ORF type:complete len:513 (-),score=101.85 TRINITY_DN15239_c0_g1_i2:131-1582(-)